MTKSERPRHPGRREGWLEILRLIREGLSRREIADRVGLTRRELDQTMFWMRRAGWDLRVSRRSALPVEERK